MKPKAGDQVLPNSCQNALQAIENNPLKLPQDVLKHIAECPMCSEVRVMWLAQEDFEQPLVQAGYFDKLPSRILQKLPVPSVRPWFRVPLLASAALIMFCVGLSGYWYGRQNQFSTVVLEAVVPPKDIRDPFLQDFTSFSSIELFSQVPTLTPEETQLLMKDLNKPEVNVQPTKSDGD